MAKQRYIVCYDITADKTRLKADKLLQGFGVRIQKSVFECWLNRGEKAKLDARLAPLSGVGVDIRCFYAVCVPGAKGTKQHASISSGTTLPGETGYVF